MATYADAADVREYTLDGEETLPDDDALERLLERAERDVDRLCEAWPLMSSGLRFDPGLLPVTAREALRRATCAQVEFIWRVSISDLITDHDQVTGVGGHLAFAARPPARIGVRAIEELSGHGLMTISGMPVEPLDVD